jgi:GNAT superfamily N-acetyltransferase
MVQIRFWQASDLPALQEMAVRSTWNITPPDDRQRTTLEIVTHNAHANLVRVLQSPHGTAIVADDRGKAVGNLLIGIQPNDKTGEPQGYLADIYVDPSYRRQGVSKGLHDVGESYLRKLGVRRMTNWTHAHNPLGLGASTHHGFDVTAVMMAKTLLS